jgi:hypothetical protein
MATKPLPFLADSPADVTARRGHPGNAASIERKKRSQDRALSEHGAVVDAYVQQEAAARRVPTSTGALRMVNPSPASKVTRGVTLLPDPGKNVSAGRRQPFAALTRTPLGGSLQRHCQVWLSSMRSGCLACPGPGAPPALVTLRRPGVGPAARIVRWALGPAWADGPRRDPVMASHRRSFQTFSRSVLPADLTLGVPRTFERPQDMYERVSGGPRRGHMARRSRH